jgi:hypothetical protein
MAWTTPLTAVANAALTDAQWNASVRDNLNETAPAKATAAGQIFVSTGANAIAARTISSARVDTSETTVSTTYAALTTAGPAVTVTTGTQALAFLTATVSNNTAGSSAFASVAVSGATVTAASDNDCLRVQGGGTTDVGRASALTLFALTPGSNTFTTQYRVGAGTGTFSTRVLTVVPL